jgi:hypothetical protein
MVQVVPVIVPLDQSRFLVYRSGVRQGHAEALRDVVENLQAFSVKFEAENPEVGAALVVGLAGLIRQFSEVGEAAGLEATALIRQALPSVLPAPPTAPAPAPAAEPLEHVG